MYRLRTAFLKSPLIVLACRMRLIGLMLGCCVEVWAQGHAVADKASGSTGLTAVFDSELAQAEQDMALRLEELEGLKQQHDNLQQALAAARSAQAEAESSGDERRQKAALEDVQPRPLSGKWTDLLLTQWLWLGDRDPQIKGLITDSSAKREKSRSPVISSLMPCSIHRAAI